MMKAGGPDVQGIALGGGIGVHGLQGFTFAVVGTQVQALHAQPFGVGEEFHRGEIRALFGGGLLHGPLKHFPRHKLRQAEQGNPGERFLMPQVKARPSLLPP